MTLAEFAQQVEGLAGMAHVEKIKHFVWFLQTGGKDRVSTTDVRGCYDQLHYAQAGNPSQLMKQMAEKDPPDLLHDNRGYRLEGRLKEQLDAKYGQRLATIAVDAMLQSLPGKISDEGERQFLSEALNCFRVKAYRATIVMTWNVAFDHFLRWIVDKHLPDFNAAIGKRFPKMAAVAIAKREDFAEEFKESQVIEIAATAGFLSADIKKILNEKLNRRNSAAHPSLLDFGQYQAEEMISDLVNNVILKLT